MYTRKKNSSTYVQIYCAICSYAQILIKQWTHKPSQKYSNNEHTGKLEAEAPVFVVKSVILACLEDACKQVEAETQTPYRRCYCHEDLPVVLVCVHVFQCCCATVLVCMHVFQCFCAGVCACVPVLLCQHPQKTKNTCTHNIIHTLVTAWMRHKKRTQTHTDTQTRTHTNTHKAHAQHSPEVVWPTKEKRKNGNQYKIGSARKICPKQSNRGKGGAIKQRRGMRRRWLCVGGGGRVCVRAQPDLIHFNLHAANLWPCRTGSRQLWRKTMTVEKQEMTYAYRFYSATGVFIRDRVLGIQQLLWQGVCRPLWAYLPEYPRSERDLNIIQNHHLLTNSNKCTNPQIVLIQDSNIAHSLGLLCVLTKKKILPHVPNVKHRL